MQLDFWPSSKGTENFVDRVNNLDPFHRAEIYGCSVLDLFRGQDRSAYDVVDVRPVANLFAGSPHDEGILTDKRSRDECDDCVVLNPARAIDSKITAGRGPHSPFFVVGPERHFSH